MRRISTLLLILSLSALAHGQSISGSASTSWNSVTVSGQLNGGYSDNGTWNCYDENGDNYYYQYKDWLASPGMSFQTPAGPGGPITNVTQLTYSSDCQQLNDYENTYSYQFTFNDTLPGDRTVQINAPLGDDGGGSSQTSTGVSYTVPGGSLYPKYQVLAVWYAPPGSKSSTDYGTSTAMGSSKSWENSFSMSTSVSVSYTGTIPLLGSGTYSASTTQTQTQDNTTSISTNKTSSIDYVVPGPASDDVGIDHDYDQVLVWLNPVANFALTSSTSAIWSYSFDQRDPANEVDVIALYVKDLKALQGGTYCCDSSIPQRLARTWAQNSDDGSGPGLTSDDYAAILARDPFSNGQTTIDSTRFDLQSGSTFSYSPPPCGGQPDTTTYTQNYQTTSTQGQTATDTYNVKYGKSGQASFLNWLQGNATFMTQQELTWTNKWGHQTSQGSGQSAKLSITGPKDCTYTGKTNVQVYQDNVYKTFMFAFVD